jgi:hypothetical protein
MNGEAGPIIGDFPFMLSPVEAFRGFFSRITIITYPQAKQTDPSLIVDPSFVRRIDQSGFIGALYKK